MFIEGYQVAESFIKDIDIRNVFC